MLMLMSESDEKDYAPLVEMPQPRVDRIKRNQIRDRVRDMILRGQLPPGSRLGQKELANRCGVAQGVVREALLELQRTGLVESIERRGVYVARLDRQTLLEALELREIHEAFAVRRCCERSTRLDMRQLVDVAERIYQLARAGKKAEMDALDHQLHGRLLELAGNGMLRDLSDNYRFLGQMGVGVERDERKVREEHVAILTAIADGRADDAERLIRHHIAATREAIESVLER
jgi:DNA-binding GntR family transcriptional regulator